MAKQFAIDILEDAKNKLRSDNDFLSNQVQDLYKQADKLNDREIENNNRIEEIDGAITKLRES